MNKLDFSKTIENMVRFKFFTRIPTETISIVNRDRTVIYEFKCVSASSSMRHGDRYKYENCELKGCFIEDGDLIEFINEFDIHRVSVKDSICFKNENGCNILYGLDYIIEVSERV